jgi:arginyl-tRNA synthetase
MKSIIQKHLYKALESIQIDPFQLQKTVLPIEYSRTVEHGDFSSSIALILAKSLNIAPVTLAQKIVEQLYTLSTEKEPLFQKIEVVPPGFINFFIHPTAWLACLPLILNHRDKYGASDLGQQKRILVEFVSSNPTGPLHVGHGRAAAQGDILVRLLKTLGYQVHAEYYLNDAGRQVDILACSIWLRYLEASGESFLTFPANAYQGEYIRTIAAALQNHYGTAFYQMGTTVIEGLHSDHRDKEKFIDALITRAKTLLGQEHYTQLLDFGLIYIIEDIQADLTDFDVRFDQWFSERSLIESGSVSTTIQSLIERGHTYKAEGNLWFRSTAFGDDKDRVLLRANGQPTYFAVDAAYRINILQTRGFDRMINLLGADHHGYLTRIHAVAQALGHPPDKIIFSILQMVSLYRGHEKLSLSTRGGNFITLRALRTEVGNDAARLFFVLRKSTQAIDFDLNLAKSASHQNPVYYLQYAYARIASIMRQLAVKGLKWDLQRGLCCLTALSLDQEIQLIKQLARYPDILVQAEMQYEPSILVQYLRQLAKYFHAYYNHTPVLTEDEIIRSARLTLMHAIQQVLKNGFFLLGIHALDRM